MAVYGWCEHTLSLINLMKSSTEEQMYSSEGEYESDQQSDGDEEELEWVNIEVPIKLVETWVGSGSLPSSFSTSSIPFLGGSVQGDEENRQGAAYWHRLGVEALWT